VLEFSSIQASWKTPDLLVFSSTYVGELAEIIQHMNADHKDALVSLAQEFARIESQEATMAAVDRLGFHVSLKTRDGMGA